MPKKIALAAVAGGVGLTGALLIAPNLAIAASGSTTPTPSTSSGIGGRLSALRQALQSLVTDQTLTATQADKVAATLDAKLPRGPRFGGHAGFGDGFGGGPDGRFGGRGGAAHLHADEVAKAVGLSVTQLRAELMAGKSLTAIAQAKGISKADLIQRLLAAAKADLVGDVSAGRLTQAEADMISNGLLARITERVDRVGLARHDDEPQGPAPSNSGTPAAPSSLSGSPA